MFSLRCFLTEQRWLLIRFMRCSSFRATTNPLAKSRFVEARIGLLVSAGEGFPMTTTPSRTIRLRSYFALQSLLPEPAQVKFRRPKKPKRTATSGLALRLPALRPQDF